MIFLIKHAKKSLNENYDVVLHFAALINNQGAIKKKKEYLDNNYNKSKIFLKFCNEKGIKNFIFSSSASIAYGSSTRMSMKSQKQTHWRLMVNQNSSLRNI